MSESRRGCIAAALVYLNPSVGFADSSPAGEPFGCSTNMAYSAVPLRGAIVSMGLRGSPGGLRGEIEIFPGPLAKRYEVAYIAICLFYSLRLLASLASTSLDREAFGTHYKLKY